MKHPELEHISMPDYLAHPAYGSSDFIKMLKRGFAFWMWRKSHPEPKGRPLVIGSATHSLLEAELAGKGIGGDKSGILVYGDGSSLTKGFKAFQDANPAKHCLDVEENALVARMVKALLGSPEVMAYLDGAIAEPTLFRDYPGTALPCKCRPDYLHVSKGVSINLKTTNDASESGFIYGARDYGYDIQSALYIDLLSDAFDRPFDEVHILIEKTDEGEPARIKIYNLGDDTLAFARTQLRSLIEQIPSVVGRWPNPTPFLQTIDIPLHLRTAP